MSSGASDEASTLGESTLALRRARMVDEQILGRDVTDARVIAAMRSLPRERFVPESAIELAYGDAPVPIGAGQTLSQPYMVALMTEVLELDGSEKILEIGTGSGYQTALLASLAREVFTVELVESLAAAARRRLEALGFDNVRFRVGDGRLGWPEEAPFDGILVAAAPVRIPAALREQLTRTARLVIPLGPRERQELTVHQRDARDPAQFTELRLGAVRFVPLL